MKKVKIEIKNRWTGNVLFEYEKEDNTLKDTLEQAIKEDANLRDADLEGANLRDAYLRDAYLRGANLRGANLRGADLRCANLRGANLRCAYLRDADLEGADLEGADLRGAYIYMWDNNEPNINEVISNLEENSNIRIKSYYINKHVLTPYYRIYWKNGLIIDEYEIVESKQEVKKMTVSEICEELGYDVEIVKED